MEVMKRTKALIMASFSATHLFFLFRQPNHPRPSPSRPLPPPQPSTTIDSSAADTVIEIMPALEEEEEEEEAIIPNARRHNYSNINSSSTPVAVGVIDWGKTIFEFCLMTALALIPLSSQQTTHLNHLSSSFYVFCVLILLAFASSLAGLLFRGTKLQTTAAVLEHMGITFAVLAFFMVMGMSIISPPGLKWVTWLICALSFFSFFIYYYYMNIA